MMGIELDFHQDPIRTLFIINVPKSQAITAVLIRHRFSCP